MMRNILPLLCAAWIATGTFMSAQQNATLSYTYPVQSLHEGHSYGNEYCYVTLDRQTDIPTDQGTPRFGLKESLNQKHYLLGWELTVMTLDGKVLSPATTTFTPAYQETNLQHEKLSVRKRFILPFENNYRRSAHFLLQASEATSETFQIQAQFLLPKDSQVTEGVYKGHKYAAVLLPGMGYAIVWGSTSLEALTQTAAESGKNEVVALQTDYSWKPSETLEYAISFAYTLVPDERETPRLLGALFETQHPASPSVTGHLFRIHQMVDESRISIDRYRRASRLWTPDAVINRAAQWAKVNQLRLRQEGKRGPSYTNNPPSDIVVARDTVWYVMGSSYYAQHWSRRLLDLWFRLGMEPSGKFIEYFTVSREPIFRDDYGLNIADSTPLLIVAAYHYYSLTGDQAFLLSTYPSLVRTADYILSQRTVGENNHYGLVWCTSKDTFVRGLPVWRNAVPEYNIAGAPTELNVECYRALQLVAELAEVMGDYENERRFQMAAQDLRGRIERHLRASTAANPFYYLTINPAGEKVADMTGDLVFPVLFGVADSITAKAILDELVSSRFWASTSDGAGGIRTVSAEQTGRWGYQAKATPPGTDPITLEQVAKGGAKASWNYGLLGGVWPNLGLWFARAAAAEGWPDLSLKALRGTFLLSERPNPAAYNVVPGEFSGYCNGDDLLQKEMPLSPFIPGIFVWSSLESFLGLSPHPDGLDVNPVLPQGWDWTAVSSMPYRGRAATILAVKRGAERTLYTTVGVRSDWKQVLVSDALQERYAFEPAEKAFWLVVPGQGNGHELLAASDTAIAGKLRRRGTNQVLLEVSIPAGGIVRKELPQ